MNDTIAVYTGARGDEIIAKGGLGDWVLDLQRASQCTFLVCCRKPQWSNAEERISKGAAFLVGRIKGFRPGVQNPRGQRRSFIELAEYASVNKAEAWQERRNPVAYTSLGKLGIKAAGLKFEPISEPSKNPLSSPGRLTIEQAKKALADTFGVSPDDIEITIRG
jgi:hypothetical protein